MASILVAILRIVAFAKFAVHWDAAKMNGWHQNPRNCPSVSTFRSSRMKHVDKEEETMRERERESITRLVRNLHVARSFTRGKVLQAYTRLLMRGTPT